MKGRAAFAAALIATPLLAQSVPDAHLDAVILAIADFGCMVDESNSDAVLAATGLTEDEASAVMSQLFVEGAVVMDGSGNALLVAGPCAD